MVSYVASLVGVAAHFGLPFDESTELLALLFVLPLLVVGVIAVLRRMDPRDLP